MFDTFGKVARQVSQGGGATPPTYSSADLMGMAVNFLIGVTFSIAIVTMAYSMLMYVTSGGNPDKTTKAWNTLIWSVLAAVIALIAVSLRSIIFGLIGLDLQGVPDLGY